MRVDLPAPEEPTSTAVTPGPSHGRSSSTVRGSLALTASTGTAGPASAWTSAWRAAASAHRSRLVSSTSGRAPLPCTRTR